MSAFSSRSRFLQNTAGTPDGVIDPKPDEPAEQQGVVHLLRELPLGTDRMEDLQQAGPDQPFRRDRRTTRAAAEPVERGVPGTQRIIDDGPDLARAGCHVGRRSSRSTQPNSGPVTGSDPRIAHSGAPQPGR